MLKFLKDLVTDHDNDGEIVSVLGTLSVLCFLVFQGYVVWTTKTFNGVEFGTGVGLVLVGLGGGYFAKSKSTTPTS